MRKLPYLLQHLHFKQLCKEAFHVLQIWADFYICHFPMNLLSASPQRIDLQLIFLRYWYSIFMYVYEYVHKLLEWVCTCFMVLEHFMCKLQEISKTCLLGDKGCTFFPLVVKSNIPSDSISSALQVLILCPACVHAFPCHPWLSLSVRELGVMKSLYPRGNRRHVDWGQC